MNRDKQLRIVEYFCYAAAVLLFVGVVLEAVHIILTYNAQ